MHSIEEVFGQVIFKKRIENRLSQEELAFRSNLNRTYISSLETGKSKASIVTLFSLAQALNVKPSDLIIETEKKLK